MSDLIQIGEQLYKASQRLDKVPAELNKQAIAYAESEREYRKALSIEEYKLRSEGMPATLIGDIARGNIAELKYDRDLAEKLFKSAVESKRALEAEVSALQSLYKNQTETGG